MKVVFLNRFFFPDHSATSQLLTDLAYHFSNIGMNVHVIASRQIYDNPGAKLLQRECVHGISVHRVWSSRFGRRNLAGRAFDYLSFYLSAGWSLLWLLRRGDVVVAKTDPPLISVVAAAIVRIRGAKLINWLQDIFPEVAVALNMRGINGIVAASLRRLRNWSLQSAAINVVLGERMATHVARQGIQMDRIRVIHNWADGNAMQPVEQESNPLRLEWGLAGQFVVGYSGNMGRAHEFETILATADALRDESDIVFLFIGGGHQREHIEREALRRGLKNVYFKQYQPRAALMESLSLPDVHLITLIPELEGLIVPSKFYGIAAVGRPVLFIGDEVGEIAQIIHAANCGAVSASGEYAKLAETILQLRNNRESRNVWGMNARKALEKYFDSEVALLQWEETVKAVAETAID